MPVQLVMADLTFQHLDAEEDYTICRGHILIASAAGEAIKKRKHESIYLNQATEEHILKYLCKLVLTFSQPTAFKSASTRIKTPLSVCSCRNKSHHNGIPKTQQVKDGFSLSSRITLKKKAVSKRIICSGSVVHCRHRSQSHKSLGNNQRAVLLRTCWGIPLS